MPENLQRGPARQPLRCREVPEYKKRTKEEIANLIEEQYGQRAMEIRQDITAVTLPNDIAAKLGLSSGSPGLLVRRWYTGPDDKAFVITISLHPGESFSYTMQMSRNAEV